MSRQAEVERVLREELWTHPDSAIEGFARAAAIIAALPAPADGYNITQWGCQCGASVNGRWVYCP